MARITEQSRSIIKIIKTKLLGYFTRFTFLLSDVFSRFFKWSFIRDTSYWVSKFDDFERKKHEGLIGLDMTALLDYLTRRSISYIDLALSEFEMAFLKLHSYRIASWITEYKKLKLTLYEKQLKIWEQRKKAAKTLPPEVYGTNCLIQSSAKIEKKIALGCKQLKKWLESFHVERQHLLDVLRVAS